MKRNMTRTASLIASIEGDQLVIRIGTETLAMAAEGCDRLAADDDAIQRGPPYTKVVRRCELAHDVACELNRTDESGRGLLTDLFDDAFLNVFQDGSLGFEDDAR